jgi:hypothetical protein
VDVLAPQIAVYRVFDVADAIDLSALAGPRPSLLRPRGGAVIFERPPLTLDRGPRAAGGRYGLLTARLYDFGVAALSWRVSFKERLSWEELVAEALALPRDLTLDAFFLNELQSLRNQFHGALVRPAEERRWEEFTVVHLRGTDPARPAADLLAEPGTAQLLLGERQRFAPEVRRDLERFAFSYTLEDLAVLAFDCVLVVDPQDIWDVADLVEFAHAELVELSYYDRILARELQRVPDVLRHRPHLSFRSYEKLRRRLMELHTEITDMHNRLRGALKVTEDLFYARIHRAAMELYGVRELDDLVEERLGVLSETYTMISEEVRYFRSELLEVGVFILILIEVLRAL